MSLWVENLGVGNVFNVYCESLRFLIPSVTSARDVTGSKILTHNPTWAEPPKLLTRWSVTRIPGFICVTGIDGFGEFGRFEAMITIIRDVAAMMKAALPPHSRCTTASPPSPSGTDRLHSRSILSLYEYLIGATGVLISHAVCCYTILHCLHCLYSHNVAP